MSDLVSRLLAAIEEAEQIARAACDERASVEGEHWQWVYTYIHDPRVDQPVDIEACNVYLGDDADGSCADVSLRSIEEYPSNYVGNLPHFAIMQAEEQKVGPARHVAHNDPAAVLRRCAADRKLLELHAQVPTHDGSTETGCKLCLWEYSWGCDIQEGDCDTVKIVAEGYGISVEEETTGE